MQTSRRNEIENLKTQFPKGTVIEIVNMDDPHAPLPGTRVTVEHVDDIGQIWTSELGIAINPEVDMFKVIQRFQIRTIDNNGEDLYVLLDTEDVVEFPGVHQEQSVSPDFDWIHDLCIWLNKNIK